MTAQRAPRRRRWLGLAVAIAAVAVPAYSDIVITQPVIHSLTQIDESPSSAQLDAVHGGTQEALDNLVAIASSAGAVDPGIQLRAIRALPQYCVAPCASHLAHTTLLAVAALPLYRDARSGSELLMLRAAIESLGVLRIPEDVNVLVPQLDHPGRDIRAATAHALRDLGNTQAIVPLRARYQAEQVSQVRIAISDALRVLGQPVQ